MTMLIGNAKPEAEALEAMRKFRCGTCERCKLHLPGFTGACATRWHAYQNVDPGHPDIGLLRFLAVGPGCTFKTAPERYPDTQHGPGWRYYRVGVVVMTTGEIEPEG